MVRTQISLTQKQMARLKAKAKQSGKSMAALIREALDDSLDRDPKDRQLLWERAMKFVGRSVDRSEETDVAVRHDDYLDEAFDDD